MLGVSLQTGDIVGFAVLAGAEDLPAFEVSFVGTETEPAFVEDIFGHEHRTVVDFRPLFRNHFAEPFVGQSDRKPGAEAAAAAPSVADEDVGVFFRAFVGVAERKVKVPDRTEDEFSAGIFMQIEAVPLGVEVLDHFFDEVDRHQGIQIDQFRTFFHGTAGESFVTVVDIALDELFLFLHDGVVRRKVVVDHIGTSGGIDDVPGSVVREFDQVAGVDGVDVAVIHIDAVAGNADFFGEKVNADVFAVQIDFHGSGVRLPCDGVKGAGEFVGNMVSLQGLVALVGEKNPDLFLAVGEVKEVVLFGEFEFIGFFRISPRVVAASADFGDQFFAEVLVVTSEHGQFRGFVFGFGGDGVTVVGVDDHDGHVENVVIEDGGVDAFCSITRTGRFRYAVAPLYKLIAEFGDGGHFRGSTSGILNGSTGHFACRFAVDGIDDLSALRRINRIFCKIAGGIVDCRTLGAGIGGAGNEDVLFFFRIFRDGFFGGSVFCRSFRGGRYGRFRRIRRKRGRFPGLAGGQHSCRQHCDK